MFEKEFYVLFLAVNCYYFVIKKLEVEMYFHFLAMQIFLRKDN